MNQYMFGDVIDRAVYVCRVNSQISESDAVNSQQTDDRLQKVCSRDQPIELS